MASTEDGFFDEHVSVLLEILYSREVEIENTGDYTPEDEMELSALGRLIVLLEEA